MLRIREKIRLDQLQDHPKNPRKLLSTDDLVLSIQESGQLVPLLVRPLEGGKYEIISGHRRKNALQRAGMLRADCDIVEMTDEQAYKALMVTNIQAQSLSELEEADGIKHMMDAYGYTQDRAAKEFGKTKMWVSYRLSLLGLNDEVKESVNARLLTPTHAREIAQLPQDQQLEIAKRVIEEKLSTRETAEIIKKLNHPEIQDSPEQQHSGTDHQIDGQSMDVQKDVIRTFETDFVLNTDEAVLASDEIKSFKDQSEPESSENFGSGELRSIKDLTPEPISQKDNAAEKVNEVDRRRIERAHDYLLALENFIVDAQPINGVIETLVELGRAIEAINLIDRINERIQFARLHIHNASTRTEGAKGEVVEFRRKDA